jgi:hypothetical protein
MDAEDALAAKVREIGQRQAAKTRGRSTVPPKQKQTQTPITTQVTLDDSQLPLWPEPYRGFPNILARSALFGCSKDAVSREFYARREIRTHQNVMMEYRGQELRQDDASVLMQLLHYARECPLGTEVDFTAYSFIKELGWTLNKTSYERLRECIERLSATNLTAFKTDHSVGYGGSLVRKFWWKDTKTQSPLRRWKVILEPEIVQLFDHGEFSFIEWQERKQIGARYLLALWLHSFFCSHRDPFPMKVTTFKELSGSQVEKLYHFRADLRKALTRLVDVGFLDSWLIDPGSDLVAVKRRPRTAAITAAAKAAISPGKPALASR